MTKMSSINIYLLMVDFIKFVEVRSFYIDLYGGNLFLPTACLPSGAPIQIYAKLLKFKDFYKIAC